MLSWYDNEWGFSNRMVDTAVARRQAGLKRGTMAKAVVVHDLGQAEAALAAAAALTQPIRSSTRSAALDAAAALGVR